MTNYFLKSFVLLAFATTIFSCTQEDTTSVEAYTATALREINESCRGGEAGCFEFVYPISITFPDGTSTTVDSKDALKAAIKAYKVANPGEKVRPEISFPVDILKEDGTLLTIASKEELKAVVAECKGTFDGPGRPGHGGGKPGHDGHGTEPCFVINYPISVAFPDGTTQEFADRAALKTALKAWKQANPDATSRPQMVFPITVTKEDGTVVTVNTVEELKALKKECRG